MIKRNQRTFEGRAELGQLAGYLTLRQLPAVAARNANIHGLTHAAGRAQRGRHTHIHLRLPTQEAVNLREGQVLFKGYFGH